MDIRDAQRYLNLPQTGENDDLTRAAIRNFQQKNGIVATGMLDQNTIAKMFPAVGGNLDTDLSARPIINQRFLSRDEYLTTNEKRRYVFLHYTAGWNNPYNVVRDWENDTRGPIATQFVIGGINPVTGDTKYDGEIVQALPDHAYGWHLGIGNTAVHRQSIGIEICNFGWLTQGKWISLKTNKWVNGKPDSFYTYTGAEVKPEFVTDLKRPFRGYRFFHSISERQIESLEYLIKMLCERHKIDINLGLKQRLRVSKDPFDAFSFSQLIRDGIESPTGIYSHTNVINSGKWDIYPAPNIIEMFTKIGGK